MYFRKYEHLLTCLFIVITAINTSGQWVVEDDGCRTPDRGVGDCIPARDCGPIVQILNESPKPLSADIIQLLQEYTCGFDNRLPKVCCPSTPIKLAQQPPDVSQHRNRQLLPKNCGVQDITSRIINGEETVLFEFPWMALLNYRSNNGADGFKCGGTVINNRYILTAAHCLVNEKLKLISVRVGEFNISSPIDCEDTDYGKVCAPPVQDLSVEEIIPHPKYNRTIYANDIGLIRVSPIKYSDSVMPICLPFDELRTYDITSKKVTVAGWVATETGYANNTLLKAVIDTVPEDECKRVYVKSAPITPSHICAGGKDRRDSCSFVSGGPLKVLQNYNKELRYIQFGVASFGPAFCGLEGNPGVYTKVTYFMDWILNTIKP